MKKLLSVLTFLCGLCFSTGCGSAGNSAPPPPAVATHFSVSTVSAASSGTPFNFTVTALDASNNTVTTYAGTVHFTSTDGSATLPANTTLTNGVKSISVTLNSAGAQTVTATDTTAGAVSERSDLRRERRNQGPPE